VQGLPKLDRYDLNILAALQANGRMTYQDLGEAVGLSASPCLQRVKRLESAGYIAGYGAWVDLNKLRSLTTVFTSVTLSAHTQGDFLRFEAGIRNYTELQECHLVSGGFDYLVKFVTRSVAHYQGIIEEILAKDIGVEKYFSYIVIKTPIIQRFPPVALVNRGPDEGQL
jgi:DNA-binding Lrp family transcriptional regulator